MAPRLAVGQRGPDPATPAEDRGAGPDVGATHPPRHVVGVSQSRPVPPRLGTSGRHLTPIAAPPCPLSRRERAARNTFEGPPEAVPGAHRRP